MKKKLGIILVTVLVMMLNIATISLAENEQVTLKSSKNKVKSGDTFEVTISQESEGLTGFESTLNYDEDVFTLTEENELGSGWINMGSGNKLDALANTPVKSGTIFKLKFSVKANVAPTTSEIKLTNVKLYKSSTEKIDFEDKSISIEVNSVTLSKIEIKEEPTKVTYKEGEKFNPSGMEVIAIYSDDTTKKITNYTYTPKDELKTENKLITISYTEDGVTKTATQAIKVNAVSNNNNNNNNNNADNNNNSNNGNNNNNNNNNSNKNNINNNPTNNNVNNNNNGVKNNTNTNNNKTNIDKTTNNTTDNTTTAGNLPKTGSPTKYILVIIAGLIGISFIAYKGYKKYKEI